MKHKLVVANWKMNPGTYKEAERLVKSVLEYGGKDVVLCPPFPFLSIFRNLTPPRRDQVTLGAQDVFYKKEGACTGEVSVGMLKDAKVKYVIVGHSERRELGDTDEIVAKKLRAALEGGLTPILCVGETERPKTQDKGLRKEKEFVRKQLKGALPPPRRGQGDNELRLIIAYEPVWAISSRSGGVSDTPESASIMTRFIKEVFAELLGGPSPAKAGSGHKEPQVLYGGSVNGKNAAGFLRLPECDGVLVGGASLRPSEFRKIVETSRNF